MSDIVISSGHGQYIRGAAGPEPWGIDEVDEARRVVENVATMLRANGVEVETLHDDVSTTQSANLNWIVSQHNARTRKLDVSIHFNAYEVTTTREMGCECWYYSQQALAADVSAALADATDLPDRGAKFSDGLAFLVNTHEPSILVEVVFVDAKPDCDAYRANYNKICQAIAEAIGGVEIDEGVEPEPPEQPETPPELTSENRVDITGAARGQVTVIVNGTVIRSGGARCTNVVAMNIDMTGDVICSINGEEFHNKPVEEIPDTQRDIITTVFGGEADNEYSAYGPYDSQGRGPYMNDEDNYVSLPWTVEGAGLEGSTRVKVINRANGSFSVGACADKGPWFVDDNYVELGTRPLAETCYLNNEPCPRGPNQGTVPNGAGIDISPNMARELGIDGKGKVDFLFVVNTEA